MYKIYIEVYAISHPYVGIGEFCLNLGRHLASHACELREKYGIELYFIIPEGREGVFGDEVYYVSFPGNIQLFTRLYGKRIDLLHLTHQYCRFKHFPRVGRELMTVHDINFMYEKQDEKLEKYIKRFNRKLHYADYISFISNFTQQDTQEHFDVSMPSRVIYNGVSKLVTDNSKVSSEFISRCPAKPFFFHISSLRPKKNVHLLIEMMAHLPQETLVVAGDWSGKYGSEMQRRIQELGLKNVVCFDNVSTDEKSWLYEHCKAFLFPSACEGFGLPPVEAMCFGKPVFMSQLTSLPEVGGEYAFFWDELEPRQMADTVVEKMAEYEQRPTEVSAGLIANANRFDWEQCANEYIQYYLDILDIHSQQNRKIIQIMSNKVWGGGEQYVKELTGHLKADGEDILIVCRSRTCAARQWKKTGLSMMELPFKGLGDVWSVWRLSRLILKGRFVLHVHNFRDAILAALARSLSGNRQHVRLLVTRHLVKPGRNDALYRWLYRQIDQVVFVSALSKNAFLMTHPEIDVCKLSVIHNSIEPKRCQDIDVRKEFGIGADVPIIMYHGRLIHEKGVDVLIDALPLLKHQNYCLLLMGEGKPSFVRRLQRKVAEYGLGDRVFFAGFRQQVVPYIRQCAFGVCPSVVRESFQLSSLEYMSQGKCVITSSHGGQSEYIDSGKNGMLVVPDDSSRLAQCMDRLLDRPDLCRQCGLQARRDFEEKHNYQSFYQRIKKVYEQLA